MSVLSVFFLRKIRVASHRNHDFFFFFLTVGKWERERGREIETEKGRRYAP